jgi:ParB family chromosome partitioning protein
VREAEALGQRRAAPERKSSVLQDKDPDTLALERRLSDALGLAVSIDNKGESGRVEIRYRTLEQLDTVCIKLTGHSN